MFKICRRQPCHLSSQVFSTLKALCSLHVLDTQPVIVSYVALWVAKNCSSSAQQAYAQKLTAECTGKYKMPPQG